MSDPGYTIFDSETGATALKWGITILVAGFIAQFGKKFATFLIEKIKQFRKRKSDDRQDASPAAGRSPMGTVLHLPGRAEAEAAKAKVKFGKKMMKAIAKERKKGT